MFHQGIAISALTILISLIVIGYLIYQFTKDEYSPFSSYASDLMNRDSLYVTKAVIFALYVAGSASTFFIFFSSFHTILGTIGGIVLCISALLSLPLPHITSNKAMSYYSILYFSFTGLGSLLAGFAGIFETQIIGYYRYPLWLAIVFIIIGIIQIGALFFPSLWNPKFFEKCEENGKVTYVRPRFSTLATYQWSYLSVSLLEIVILFIASFMLAI